MSTTDLKNAFEKALKRFDSEHIGQRLQDARREVEEMLEDAREAMDESLGAAGSALIEPWINTNEFTSRKLVLRKEGGYDVKAFTVQIPVDSYPVTIEVGGKRLQADTRDELEAALQKAITDEAVLRGAAYVLGEGD